MGSLEILTSYVNVFFVANQQKVIFCRRFGLENNIAVGRKEVLLQEAREYPVALTAKRMPWAKVVFL